MATTTSESINQQSPTTLRERFEDVKKRMEAAAIRSGRTADQIILVAVTKHASFDQIRDLIELGHVDLGENRVQHLVQRAAQVDEYIQRVRELRVGEHHAMPEAVRWHMIGNLQRNKVRKVLPLVRLIHSLDSLRLAEEIQAAAGRKDDVVEVLVEVNTSQDKKKAGIAPAATRHLIEQIDTMMNLKVRGLMCMAPLVEDPNDARPAFVRCRELFQDVNKSGVVDERFNLLSMGMSNDYEVAIECGANVVRVGTAIFGPPQEESE